MGTVTQQDRRRGFKLPSAVIALGLASFFNDIGSEMSFPLLSAFLISLGAGPTALGLIEGVADATASFLKVVAGRLADRMPRVKPLVGLGYGLPCAVRPLLSLCTAPLQVLGIRLVDRVGKGLRTAPRDALIGRSVEDSESGRAFGFHRAMDHLGGVVGPLVATVLLGLGLSVRGVFLAALVPSLLALVAVFSVRETARVLAPAAGKTDVPGGSGPERQRLPRAFSGYLWVIALFALANSSEAFLLLRAGEIGVPTTALPLLWTVLNLSRAASTYLGGHLADRLPRAPLIAAGFVLFALCYLALGFADSPWQAWAVFVVFGLHTGIVEPAERSLIREMAPEAVRGRAFGLFHGVVGLCAIPAGLGMGWMWQRFDGTMALGCAAVLAGGAALALLCWNRARP